MIEAKTDCIHCGLCLPVCPTYQELGSEADSPRGRIYMMKAAAEGRLEIDDAYVRHIYLCLGCRTCEGACPSGVEFSALLDLARAEIERTVRRPLWQRLLQRLVLVRTFGSPRLLHLAFALLRAYQLSGMQSLVRRAGLLERLPLDLGAHEALLPRIPPARLRIRPGSLFEAKGKRRARVAFLTGCVMNEAMPEVHHATLRVLAENGCEVIVPRGQVCCGALQNHAGLRGAAQALARRNIEAFGGADCDAIVVNSAGCGALLKEYGRLLAEDGEWRERGAEFGRRVRDVSEFLDGLGLVRPRRELRARVAYDHPCHLIHGQKITEAPRRLLAMISGLVLVPLKGAEECCGSAGIYNLTQREMSMRLLERKMRNIRESDAEIVATGNPGCMLQIAYGARRFGPQVEVLHPMQLLARAYGEEPG